ncbi:60 kDa lysophospholipase-like isoform X2 [Oncorhynchus tshawytscha]|uniref:60 kDa lysophospholipase-like isoform X2 n=1 Tax=Oncorhynchus tshawytscha TaxID=74940 RepID=UPI001C3C3489|nr:60 kDa lysophospholipase-like isoform X2 [Oncorhynchus tshawytscha]
MHFRHKEVVKLLRETGVRFSSDELKDAGTELCSLASNADIEGLEMWHLAGGDLNIRGYDGKMPMDVPLFDENDENEEYIEFSACPKGP